jgi:hypothetical protein
MQFFDSCILLSYNPYDESCEEDFEIPMTASHRDMPEIGLKGGYLRLKRFIAHRTQS